jgi:hypothetical protein
MKPELINALLRLSPVRLMSTFQEGHRELEIVWHDLNLLENDPIHI